MPPRSATQGIDVSTPVAGELLAPLATDLLAGSIVEPPPDNLLYARRRDLTGVSMWVPSAAGADFGLGLSLDETAVPPIVHLTPAGWAPEFLGGVYTTGGRSAIEGLDLAAAGTGQLSVPLATDLLAGSIVEPPPDGLLYVRSRDLTGVSAWVPNAAGADFGVGLSLDETMTPPMVNLQPAGDSPATLGGVYVIDRVRNTTEGLELGIDGRLRAPLATDSLAGTILEPPADDKGYVRRRDLAGNSAWVPPSDTALPDFGIGLSLDETATPQMVNLTPAGWAPEFLGGVWGGPRSLTNGLDIAAAGTGEISVPLATDLLAGSITEPTPDGLAYSRQYDNITDPANPAWVWVPALTAGLQITGIIPNKAVIGDPIVTVTVIGSEFTPTCVVVVDGTDTATTYVSPTEMTFFMNPSVPIAPSFHVIQVRDTAIMTGELGMGAEQFDFIKASTEVDYGIGLQFDTAPTPPMVNLTPAGIAPQFLGGVWVPQRSATQAADVDTSGGDGQLVVPLATDLLAGSIVEPPPDDQKYVRSRSAAGVSYWDHATANVDYGTGLTFDDPNNIVHLQVAGSYPQFLGGVYVPPVDEFNLIIEADGRLTAVAQVTDFGTGLSYDETAVPPIVHLTPAGDAPQFLGGVYVIDRERNVSEGLELGIDGRLRAPLATPRLAGTIVEPEDDGRGYVRTTLNGVSAWVPPADTPLPDFGIGLALDDPADPADPQIVNLTPAGDAPQFLGGVYVIDRERNVSEGLELGIDGRLRAPLATPRLAGTIVEPEDDGKGYVRTTLNGVSQWVPPADTQYYFGVGLSFDETTRDVNLQPAGDGPATLGGVYVIDRVRNNTEGLELGIDGRLRAPLATDSLAGTILEPPLDDKGYVRTYKGGVGAWVPPADTPLPDFGIGLALDETQTPQIVHLTPAGDSPATLGGVYVIDRVRNNTEGLELGLDGRLRVPLATDSLAGSILEPPPDDRGYVRARSPAGVSAWVPPADTQYYFGVGLSFDETTRDVNLTPAGWDPSFLGGVYGSERSATNGLDLAAAGTGEISVPLGTDLLAGSIVEPPPDGVAYSRQYDTTGAAWVWTPALTAGLQITGLIPNKAIIGEPILTVHVYGAEFTDTCVLMLDGADITSVYVSPTEMTFQMNPAVPINPTTYIVTVKDPARVPPEGLGAEQFEFIVSSTTVDYGLGLSLDTATDPPMVNLQPAGWDPSFLGGVYTTGPRSATDGLDLDALGTGKLSVPLATPDLAGSIVEPVADAKGYVRTTQLNGVSQWVPPAPSSGTVSIADAPPPNPIHEDMWWNSTTASLFIYYDDGTSAQWVQIDSASAGGVTISDTAPANPAHEDMWWDSTTAELFIYYDDGTSAQWVQVDSSGGGSAVTISDTPPTGPAHEDLWWNSTTGILFIYYDDGTSAQWVATNPATSGGGSYNFVIGLTHDDVTGDVNLMPAGDSPATLGGVYVVDRVRTATTGLELDIDGQLRAPLATEIYAGTIVEPPPDDLQYARKRDLTGVSTWVPTKAGGVTISDTPPLNPAHQDLWWESDSGDLFIYYDDGTSAQWVEAVAGAEPGIEIHVGDTPPATAKPKDLWWDSDGGSLAIYYQDVDSTQWVQIIGSGGVNTAAVQVGDTPPPSASPGMLWYDSDLGELFAYIDDGSSLQWVQVTSGDIGIPEAPVDGSEYVRKDAAWVASAGGGGGITDAPIDGTPYSRQDAAWVAAAAGGLADAPADGTEYLRKDNAWVNPTTTGLTQADADLRYLQLTGGDVTGALNVVEGPLTLTKTSAFPGADANGAFLVLNRTDPAQGVGFVAQNAGVESWKMILSSGEISGIPGYGDKIQFVRSNAVQFEIDASGNTAISGNLTVYGTFTDALLMSAAEADPELPGKNVTELLLHALAEIKTLKAEVAALRGA